MMSVFLIGYGYDILDIFNRGLLGFNFDCVLLNYYSRDFIRRFNLN